MKFYNIFIESNGTGHYELVLNEEQVKRVFDDINGGAAYTWLKGKKILIQNLDRVSLFNISAWTVGRSTQEELLSVIQKEISLLHKGKIDHGTFSAYGVNVTDSFFKPNTPQTISKPVTYPLERKKEGKIFISHSRQDSSITNRFCDLILHNGLNIDVLKNVFNTSMDGTKPISGEDFKARIKEELITAKIVLQFISNNYKTSEVCLNEMGAAWVLSGKVIPLVISNYDVGFINNTIQQLQLTSKTDIYNLVEVFKERGIIKDYNSPRLETKIEEFLTYINSHLLNNSSEPKKVVEIPKSKVNLNPFFKINNHSRPYYRDGFQFKEIPDSLTQMFLGFDKYKEFTQHTLPEESMNDFIGTPLKSITEVGKILSHDGKAWLIVGNEKRHIATGATFLALTKVITDSTTATNEDLAKFKQGDVFDIVGKNYI